MKNFSVVKDANNVMIWEIKQKKLSLDGSKRYADIISTMYARYYTINLMRDIDRNYCIGLTLVMLLVGLHFSGNDWLS